MKQGGGGTGAARDISGDRHPRRTEKAVGQTKAGRDAADARGWKAGQRGQADGQTGWRKRQADRWKGSQASWAEETVARAEGSGRAVDVGGG